MDLRASLRIGWSIALLAGIASCSRSPGKAGPVFTDATAESNIRFQPTTGASGKRYLVETMAGGLGWIDYDSDGDFDLFLVNCHSDSVHADQPGDSTDRLYRNDGTGRFADATLESGTGDRRYGFGVAVGDYDNDGRSDLFIANFGRNTLLHNDAKGAFQDVTEAAGLVEQGWSSSAAWLDMDRDGDLDLYVVRYLRYRPGISKDCIESGVPTYCHPKLFPGMPDLLYRNLGGGRFEEIGGQAGIAIASENEGKGLGVVAFDCDRDGLADVYVANDTTPNFLFRNRGDGTFEEKGQALGVALDSEGKAQAGMGVDVADVNGDGVTDIHVSNFSHELNALYLGGKDGIFTESARMANLGSTFLPLGFGTLFLDADLDGDQDILTANGHVNDIVERTDPGTGATYRQRMGLLTNDGAGKFSGADQASGDLLGQLLVGRGLARSDFDGDGDIDAALMTLDRGLMLLRNDTPVRPGLVIRLEGTKSPRDAYGARLEIEVAGKLQVFEYQSARSYLSASDPRVIVATLGASKVDRITIRWPSGLVQELRDVRPVGSMLIREPAASESSSK